MKLIGPLAYQGKKDCQSLACRSLPDGEGGWLCIGYHCAYCDEPCSSQGHRCDAAEAVLRGGEGHRTGGVVVSGSRLRPVSPKRRRRDRDYPRQRDRAYERARGVCEARVLGECTGQVEAVHHIAGRGGPDPHRLDNLLAVCASCHRWIHRNPVESYQLDSTAVAGGMLLGLLRSRHGRAT